MAMRKVLRTEMPDYSPMQDESDRYAHVVKHVYDPAERWDLIVMPTEGDLGRASRDACSPAALDRKNPKYAFDCATVDCINRVLDDAKTHYEPAYRNAIRLRVAECSVADDGRGPGTGCVGANGVFVIIREDSATSLPIVRTAHRVAPRGVLSRNATNEEFVEEAVRKLGRQSSSGGGSK